MYTKQASIIKRKDESSDIKSPCHTNNKTLCFAVMYGTHSHYGGSQLLPCRKMGVCLDTEQSVDKVFGWLWLFGTDNSDNGGKRPPCLSRKGGDLSGVFFSSSSSWKLLCCVVSSGL